MLSGQVMQTRSKTNACFLEMQNPPLTGAPDGFSFGSEVEFGRQTSSGLSHLSMGDVLSLAWMGKKWPLMGTLVFSVISGSQGNWWQ